MPDDHSEVVPLLPIPNRTVKRFSADDSADSRVKVGHRQAIKPKNAQSVDWAFFSFTLSEKRLVAFFWKDSSSMCVNGKRVGNTD